MTDDEQFTFLPIREENRTGLLIAPADPELVRFLAGRLERLTVADWEPSRTNELRESPIPLASVITIGREHWELPLERFDFVLTVWGSLYLYRFAERLNEIVERVAPRGVFAMIEPVARPLLPEQKAASELLGGDSTRDPLPAEDAVAQSYPQPSGAALINLRQRIFTDPDLLFDGRFWNTEAARISAAHPEIVSPNATLKTPPFIMISAKRKPGYVAPFAEETASPEPEPLPSPTRGTAYSELNARLLKDGADSLKNHELLTLALDGGGGMMKQGDIDKLTRQIFQEYGAKAVEEERNPSRLADMLSISLADSCRFISLLEIGRRIFALSTIGSVLIRSPEEAYEYLKDMRELKKENFRGLYLNVQSYLIHDEVISIGLLNKSLVHPREVFAPALEHSAASVIVAHNHPSGELTPSDSDVNVTKQLDQAAHILGIELVDHLIISRKGFISLKKEKVF